MLFYHQQFPVILETDETGGFVVSCPSFEGCYSQGDTAEEALTNIKEAIALCIEEIQESKQPLLQKDISLHLVQI
jgi:predicted RNase H-like HicB family nuclease